MSLAIASCPGYTNEARRLPDSRITAWHMHECIFSENVGMPNLNIVYFLIIGGAKFRGKGMPYFLRKFGMGSTRPNFRASVTLGTGRL